MKSLVTGGAGFIGSHLVDALVHRGDKVLVIDDLSTGYREHLRPSAELLEASVCSTVAADAVREFHPDTVFHLAAQASVARSVVEPAHNFEVNVLGTLNIALASAQARVKRLVYSSSAAVYGSPRSLPVTEAHQTEPLSPYGVAKLAAERYLTFLRGQGKLDSVILRYANVYGPRQTAGGEAGVVSIFVDRVRNRLPVEIHGDGQQTRDFVHVSDVVRANMLAAETGAPSPLNISTGRAITVLALCNTIAACAGQRTEPVHLPPRDADIYHSILDNSLARQVLGWEPQVALAEGLASLVRESA